MPVGVDKRLPARQLVLDEHADHFGAASFLLVLLEPIQRHSSLLALIKHLEQELLGLGAEHEELRLFFFGLLLLFIFRRSFLRFIFSGEYGRRDASDPWIAVPARPGQVRLLFTRWRILILLHLHHAVKCVLVELDLRLLSEVNILLIRT